MRPKLFTFDIFGTVVDWRRGLTDALRKHGVSINEVDFEKIINAQSADEKQSFRPYCEITARSLVKVLDVPQKLAENIGAKAGEWPLFPDSKAALKRLMKAGPCIAITNSDLIHAQQVQKQLGFRFTEWMCAEELGMYKPDPEVWRTVARRLQLELNQEWWHVSAYGDYDLKVVQGLGLTGVFVARPHSVIGPSEHQVSDLGKLADLVSVVLQKNL